MDYDFDTAINRRGTNSLKWDVGDDELPMWVADMDFKTAPQVAAAIAKRAQSGVFGYEIIPDEWYSAITRWWSRRHNFEIKKDWLCFCTGVIPAVTSAVKRVTNHGDNVIVQTPVYDIFFHSIENTGRHVLENKLLYQNGTYAIDFDDLEKKLADPLTTMLILCNPHNPAGRVWTKGELQKIGALCHRYGVTVLSDEIHCDLTEPNVYYTPFAAASEECKNNSITCVAPSKAFNLAGLQSAAVIVPRKDLRNKIVRGLNSDEVAEPNSFAITGAIAAFNEGEEWLDALRVYLSENRKIALAFLKEHLPEITAVEQTATYLLWLDCSAICTDTRPLCDHIRQTTGLYITAGGQYRGDGKTFVRINVACPKTTLADGLNRLERGVKSFLPKL
ncbi:MAG: pyridoxal phosphate-dependent aminotransferase [Clostridiales bacterium]|nr:pyridoxal phosphate-dependent aminotransferase [Clostridiales bacterium]